MFCSSTTTASPRAPLPSHLPSSSIFPSLPLRSDTCGSWDVLKAPLWCELNEWKFYRDNLILNSRLSLNGHKVVVKTGANVEMMTTKRIKIDYFKNNFVQPFLMNGSKIGY